MAVEITKANFTEEVIESSLPVLVDFWAPWCGPCRVMGPIVDELSAELSGKAKVCKINVDTDGDLAGQFGIMTVPTFAVFKNGKLVKKDSGGKSKEELESFIIE